jgi:hypothetical protein
VASDPSFERLPEARIRMREGGKELLVAALNQKDGHLICGTPRVTLLEGEVYIEVPMNVSKGSNIVFLGLDILIPVKVEAPPEPTP